MRALILALALISGFSNATCFVVGELNGYSVRELQNFVISEDGINNQKFIVEINGDNSKVSDTSMTCMQTSQYSLLCHDGVSAVETWAIYPDKGKVIYTSSTNARAFNNGANMFVGIIKGRCD